MSARYRSFFEGKWSYRIGLVTPASLATVSIDTAWNPELPNTRRATSRSWALRSGARILRREPFVWEDWLRPIWGIITDE
jgi:hypothetical protein